MHHSKLGGTHKMSWNEYSSFICSELSLVLVLAVGLGIVASLCPFLSISRLRSLACARCNAGHSSVTLVCVVCRRESSGARGESRP